MKARPPWIARILEVVFIRGDGADFVRGDLLERYRADLARSMGLRRAGIRAIRRVLASAAAWWAPSAVRRRRRDESRTSGQSRGRSGRLKNRTGEGWMSGWLQDLGTTIRGVRRRPAFSVGVAVTLGLGIAATTTIYSVVDAVLVSPLPFEDAARLASVGTTFPTREWADAEGGRQHLAGIAMLNLRDYGERNRSFEVLAGIEMTNVLLPDEGSGPELAPAARVDDGFFQMFGISPALGRGFLPEEHSVASTPVVMLSHGAWQRRFGGDPDVVGRALGRAGGAFTVVGVLPRGIELPEAVFGVAPDFWLPLMPDHPRYADRSMRSLYVTGRLRPDTDVEGARVEARAIAAELATEHPDGNVYPDGSHFGIGVNGLKSQTVGSAARPLTISSERPASCWSWPP